MAKLRSTKAKNHLAPDPFTVLRPRVAKALIGLSAELAEDWREENLESCGRPSPTEFPVPELVLFALRNVMGFRWMAHGEKVRWSVYGTYTGIPVSFEMRKFGFTICADKGAKIDLRRLCGQLHVAVKHVEDWLAPFAKEQAAKGNVTVANRHSEFDSRYRFFRDLADKSYRRADRIPRRPLVPAANIELPSIVGDLAANWNHRMRANTEGFFYSVAMVDAFFSRLEHMLVLLRAFCGRPLRDGELNSFLSMAWNDKLKQLVNVDEPRIQKLYTEMKRIKERVRNPFAHGGVENDGGSLFVHIPTVGAMPSNFTQIKKSIRFNFMPVEKDDHGSTCLLFDAFDQALREGPLRGAFKLIDNGIDPSFAANHLAKYKDIAEGPEADRELWCQHWHYENDRHTNMDY